MICNLFICLFEAKSRRQSKPYKPKKIIKMEGKIVISTACNNGSSSVISKDGELYMFGKDAIYSDSTSKLNVCLLSDFSSRVIEISLEVFSLWKLCLCVSYSSNRFLNFC